MFTGIIEETGVIRAVRAMQQGASLVIAADTISPSLKVGDSIAVNGVCLTATECSEKVFSCDLSSETLKRTSFVDARPGAKVNLERPLEVGARLGGHFVLGHVDGVGSLVSAVASGDGSVMSFRFPPELARYCVQKGSVAIDGMSLTIASLQHDNFSVAVIPHTLKLTTLGLIKVGDMVNIEVDILGKYFERFAQLGLLPDHGSSLTLDYLKNQGF